MSEKTIKAGVLESKSSPPLGKTWICANDRPAKIEDMRVLNPQTNQFVLLSRPTCY